MNDMSQAVAGGTAHRLATLLELLGRARVATAQLELQFLLTNETLRLTPYRQAALWSEPEGVVALSGLAGVEENAPYVVWLERVARHLAAVSEPLPFAAADLPDALAAEFGEWLPEHALWAPIPDFGGDRLVLILARDEPWSEAEVPLLREWLAGWSYSYATGAREGSSPGRRLKRLIRNSSWRSPAAVARNPLFLALALALLAMILPIRLSVLAPAELVPQRPAVIRAPMEGVVDAVVVQPNQRVRAGQPLFRIETNLLATQREAAQQALAAAEEEYRQTAQRALTDDEARAELALLAGKLDERRAQAELARDAATRAAVTAPVAGVVLFDDPTQLAGKPVAVGERVMRIAQTDAAEVEAWVEVGDAIELEPGAPVKLYLDARPLSPVKAKLRYFSHEPVERPNGVYAYRTRATVERGQAAQIGLKGTARLQGDWVPAVYWILRRPIGAIRAKLGV
jgi:biotin carboxyl carrier protein